MPFKSLSRLLKRVVPFYRPGLTARKRTRHSDDLRDAASSSTNAKWPTPDGNLDATPQFPLNKLPTDHIPEVPAGKPLVKTMNNPITDNPHVSPMPLQPTNKQNTRSWVRSRQSNHQPEDGRHTAVADSAVDSNIDAASPDITPLPIPPSRRRPRHRRRGRKKRGRNGRPTSSLGHTDDHSPATNDSRHDCLLDPLLENQAAPLLIANLDKPLPPLPITSSPKSRTKVTRLETDGIPFSAPGPSHTSPWIIPEDWKFAKRLLLKKPISAEMFLTILHDCPLLQRISVILDHHEASLETCLSGPGNARICAANLEMLSLTTSVEPLPILDALLVPKLTALYLGWDRTRGHRSAYPESSEIGFCELAKRSSCALKSLELFNVYPPESELMRYLLDAGQALEKLHVWADPTLAFPRRSSGRLVTDDTIRLFQNVQICPRLRILQLAFVAAIDGRLTVMMENRRNAGKPIQLTFSLRYGLEKHIRDLAAIFRLSRWEKAMFSVQITPP
ncbi:hypothetical protein DXG03_004151 [Asterophora parasitica]|uniref:Uncharacterized protein n=1 Tax=Asterophora parasitica TaxID=117018 RepID=A0A9P7G2Y6_9AGAR|nr:hypothetical protein DXG03_004151 [Asterophora parasitica]